MPTVCQALCLGLYKHYQNLGNFPKIIYLASRKLDVQTKSEKPQDLTALSFTCLSVKWGNIVLLTRASEIQKNGL